MSGGCVNATLYNTSMILLKEHWTWHMSYYCTICFNSRFYFFIWLFWSNLCTPYKWI